NVAGFAGEVPLGPMLSEAMGGVPVRVENDVHAGVLGELERGAARPYRECLGIWVGTGVGGGLVFARRLHTGAGAAGEIGHMVIRPGGRLCSCGRRGCLEAYAGRASMERRAHELVQEGQRTSLFHIMRSRGSDRLTSGVWRRAQRDHDAMARSLLRKAAWALGIAMASAQNLLDLEAILIGGGLGDKLGEPFRRRAQREMERHLFSRTRGPVVLGTQLGDLAGAVGAAQLVAAPAQTAARPERRPAPSGLGASAPARGKGTR
ncbi:MAG: ROK family protein, partial [Acidobacteriota bacterium]|nr:ROK family protein [Acidobacteriota bacterium]